MPREPKNRNMKQLIASLIVDVETPEGSPIYVIKAPIAGSDRAKEVKGNLTMYGVQMTEGIGICTDPVLAAKITSEFPEYTAEELK